MELYSEILSNITIHMKYARYIESLNRRELWKEIVYRNRDMHILKYPELSAEITKVYEDYVLTKKILPSMRSLQFAGKPIDINPVRLYNCSFLHMNDWRAFSEVMFLLLSGVGVGYSVQFHHVDQLPEIKKPTKNRRYLIGDSVEGWSDAVKILIKSYLVGGPKPVFDFRDIRPKGSKLITSGGKAPGPEPLKDCLYQIEKILDRKNSGDKLTTVEVHGINCHIADAVLSGGIRRAALIALFSFDDDAMLTCKFGKWYETNPEYARANNTAVILRNRIKKDEFFQLWKKIEESKSGEPGFMFTDDVEYGLNPCAEVSLLNGQFCVAGDTKLITKEGIVNIKDSIGKNIEVWNGKEWSKVSPYKTGDADKLYRVWISDGTYLDATSNHKFLVKQPHQNIFKEMDTTELINWYGGKGFNSRKSKLQLPRTIVKCDDADDGYFEEYAYEYGFFTGDGNLSYRKNRAVASLYGEDKKLPLRGKIKDKIYYNQNRTEYRNIWFDMFNIELSKKLKMVDDIPVEIFSWTKKSILNFVAGWLDADGSNQGKGVRLYGTLGRLKSTQLLLTKVGIESSLNLCSKSGSKTNLGYRKNDLWYLQIVRTADIPCNRLICNNENGSKHKNKYQSILFIEKLDGVHESFCLTENKLHQCLFNNILTKQCNLVTINADTVKSQEDLEERCTFASFIATLQAGYTNFHYLRDMWKKVTEKEALIGVSMTGISSGKVNNLNLEKAVGVVKSENERVAKLIGINVAARNTVIKPEGTSSLVLGTSSGIHSWHDDYFIRTIRVGKNEAIYTYLANNHPELIEDDFFKPKIQSIISVPMKAPASAIIRKDETAISLLERVLKFNMEWIRPGHRKGSNYNNVSATITIKDNEWKEVGTWLWSNKQSYTALSFLPYDDHSYVQAPFQSISKSKYYDMLKTLHEVDLSKVIEDDDNTDLKGQVACAGNSCEIL